MADLVASPPEGQWDAVVSALAIHHLPDAEKRALFRRVLGALVPGGVFVNVEQVLAPSPRLQAWYERLHEMRARDAGSDDREWAGAVRRMSHDRCATVEAQLGWLRDAGFAEVDVVAKAWRFCVYAGWSPSPSGRTGE